LISPLLSRIQLANTDFIVDYFKVLLLFTATAIAEIVGCYLPYLWLKHDKSVWLLLPASFSLALFVWLLTLHPAAAGRVYAAYGGVYVAVAVGWLWFVDGVSPSRWDIAGVVVMLTGATIIAFQPQNAA
jgi:small multidrug resistance family-3 protein